MIKRFAIVLTAAAVAGAVYLLAPIGQAFWRDHHAAMQQLREQKSEVSTLKAQQAAQWATIEVLQRVAEEARLAALEQRGRPQPAPAPAATHELERRADAIERRLANIAAMLETLDGRTIQIQDGAAAANARMAAAERRLSVNADELRRVGEQFEQLRDAIGEVKERIALLRR